MNRVRFLFIYFFFWGGGLKSNEFHELFEKAATFILSRLHLNDRKVDTLKSLVFLPETREMSQVFSCTDARVVNLHCTKYYHY